MIWRRRSCSVVWRYGVGFNESWVGVVTELEFCSVVRIAVLRRVMSHFKILV